MRPLAREVVGPLGYSAQQSNTPRLNAMAGLGRSFTPLLLMFAFFYYLQVDVLGNNEVKYAPMKFAKSNHARPPFCIHHQSFPQ